MKELISVIVLCYRKFEFIYAAINSVLSQDYPNIELIISDDGSLDFPKERLEKYIDKHKKENITNIIFNQEVENVGTVKHLNDAIQLTHGKYIVALAADDIFYDDTVLGHYVQSFQNAGEDCYIEMAQTVMCDYTLKKVQGYYLQANVRELLEKGITGKKLFSQLAYKPYLPSTSTCFKKEFFERFGRFDEQYKLMEDVPMHLRLAREGWKIHYENFLAIKHRTGGISHGNTGGLSKAQYWYYCDWIKVRDNEIKPYYDLIEDSMKEAVRGLIEREERWIKSQLHLFNNDRKMLKECKKEFPLYMLKMDLINYAWKFREYSYNCFKWGLGILFVLPILNKGLVDVIDYSWINIIVLILYIVSWILLGMGVTAKILEMVGRFVIKIEHFPEETLIIG